MDAQNNEIHMPHKSIFIKVFFKWRFAVAIATAILILFLFSCKKIVEDTQMDIAQQYFKNNILKWHLAGYRTIRQAYCKFY